jgi:hypothetical protein
MNGTHLVLAYAEDVRLIDNNIRTIETKYMEVRRHRVMMANEQITVGSNSSEKVKTF